MLVIKNHPLDNGLINYRRQIQRLAERHRLLGRVHFIDGGDLNLLAKHAAGIVTVNSTAAMSGILEKVPTIVLGKAIFDLPGLTFQHGLDRFWEEHTSQVVSRDLLEAFRRVVLEQCQINGNFYTAIGQQTALQMCVRRLC